MIQMSNNLTPTIQGGGNREEQDDRLETMRLMLTMTTTMMMVITAMSIGQLPHVYLPTGVCKFITYDTI